MHIKASKLIRMGKKYQSQTILFLSVSRSAIALVSNFKTPFRSSRISILKDCLVPFSSEMVLLDFSTGNGEIETILPSWQALKYGQSCFFVHFSV